MTRPFYETSADRGHESRITGRISQKFKCTFEKLPIKMGMDYAAVRNGKAVAFLEIKRRNVSSCMYPTYMISVHKLMMAKSLSELTALPCYLFVEWTDRTGFIKLPPPNMTIRIGGRSDRNDADDIEPVSHFPIGDFRSL
jgi:hypothetical protein